MIFIDADGTLWRENPLRYVLEKISEEYDKKNKDKVFYSLVSRQEELLLRGRYVEAFDRRKTVREQLGEERERRMMELVHEYADRAEAFPEAMRLLDEVDSVVVSNGFREFIEPPLRGLGYRYKLLVTPDTVLKDDSFVPRVAPIKPFRPIYVRAMVKSGKIPEAMIGDNYLMDGIGAVRAGIPKAYVLTMHSRPIRFTQETLHDGVIDIAAFADRVIVTSRSQILHELL